MKTAAPGRGPAAATSDDRLAREWRTFRTGLRLVHTAVAADVRDDREARSAALRAVAESPAFAPFGPEGTGSARLDRGIWLVDRVVAGVERARDSVPARVPGGLKGAAEQAVVLWCLHVAVGVGLADLGENQNEDIDPPLGGRDLAQKIEGRMWLSAKPTGRARSGIEMLYHEVQAALRDRHPARGSGPGADESALAHFSYEWRRAGRIGWEGERLLLTLLGTLAPAPVRTSWLTEAWGPLPGRLRELSASTSRTAQCVRRLLDRGLLLSCTDAGPLRIALPAQLHPLPLEQVDEPERRRWTGVALRFLGVALRGDTHDHDSWAEWRDAKPHVLHLADRAEQHGEGLAEAADLLDRLSVFHRFRDDSREAALDAGARAVRLYEAEGAPDQERYATYLTNHALALLRARGAAEALPPMERAVELSAQTPNAEYAQALNLYASVLEAAGRVRRAAEVFEDALEQARAAHRDTGTAEDAEAVRMVLNDYCVHLLRHSAGRTAARRALGLLDEADRLGEPDGYGSEQLALNRARALRVLGRLAEARDILQRTVEACEQWEEPSLLLFAALADQAEVLEELGDPRHRDVLRRAHEVDEQLLDVREGTPGSG